MSVTTLSKRLTSPLLGSSNVSGARQALQKLSALISKKDIERELLNKQLLAALAAIQSTEKVIDTKEKAQAALTSLEEIWHEVIIRDIETFISDALSQIFEEVVKFHVLFDKRGDATVVDFELEVDGIKTPILDGKGGGYVNAVSFLLRLMVLLKSKPALEPFLLLDESFVNVSSEYIFNVARFLSELSKRLNVQIILITHRPELMAYADNSYSFTLKNSETVVTTQDNKDDVSEL